MKLSDIAIFVTDKISSNAISLKEYITTDCIKQNKEGREIAVNLPPQPCNLTHYQCSDILIANIRPYLKKIWFADIKGGASSDVLVIRAKENHSPEYLYALLMQDSFFDYVMLGSKGSKMPRGDKNQIMDYEIPYSPESEESIGKFIINFNHKISLNRAINKNLEALAKQIYDYWFVQFDFPNEEGKPYKSSGGAMVWNEKLNRELPLGWENSTLGEICNMYQPQTIGTDMLIPNGKYRVYGANGVVGLYDQFNHKDSEIAMACRGNSCGVLNRTMPFSWITGNAMVIQLKDSTIHNEYIKQSLAYMNVAGAITGSGQPQLTRENLKCIKCVKPKQYILQKYSEVISPIINLQIQINNEITYLSNQRDYLIPLLMNGQVTVE